MEDALRNKRRQLSGEGFGKPVLCLPGLGRLDDCAVVVADLLRRLGIATRPASASTVEDDKTASICICYLESISEARIGYAVRKLSRQAPSAKNVVALRGDNTSSAEAATTQNAARSLEETVSAFTEVPVSKTSPAGPTKPGHLSP